MQSCEKFGELPSIITTPSARQGHGGGCRSSNVAEDRRLSFPFKGSSAGYISMPEVIGRQPRIRRSASTPSKYESYPRVLVACFELIAAAGAPLSTCSNTTTTASREGNTHISAITIVGFLFQGMLTVRILSVCTISSPKQTLVILRSKRMDSWVRLAAACSSTAWLHTGVRSPCFSFQTATAS